MNFLAGVQLVANLLPLVHQLVVMAEALFPGASRGAQKLDAVVTAVQNLAPAIGATAQQAVELKSSVQTIASTVVAAMNAGSAPAGSGAASSSGAIEAVPGT
jgi:hypothetical protein